MERVQRNLATISLKAIMKMASKVMENYNGIFKILKLGNSIKDPS